MDLYLVLGMGFGGLIAFVLFFSLLFRKVVPTNEVHIVQNGKATLSYGKDTGKGNTYYRIPSWVPFFGIEVKSLPVSIFNIELDAYDAYDKGRLQFLVDVVAFFRISDYAQAAQRVASIQELESQLTSIVQGSVRSILAKSEIEQIMEERSVFGELFTKEVIEQLKSWGVEAVKNIELMDVKDAKGSEIIHNIMSKKKSHIEMESRLEVAKNRKFAEIAEIESRREVDLQKQDYQQQVGLRTVEVQQRVEMAEENKKQTITEQSKLTTEKELEVTKLKTVKAAEIAKEAAIVKSNQDKEVEIINANRLKDVALLKANQDKEAGLIQAEQAYQVRTKLADADFNVKKKTAEADLDVKLKLSQGIAAEGKAKAEAETAMLLAPVEAQTTLAQKIGENKEYQNYLITLEKVKADQAVGVANAQALANANIKVIANTGNINNGLNSVKDLISSNGGTQLGTMIEGFANTEMGQQILNKVGLETKQ